MKKLKLIFWPASPWGKAIMLIFLISMLGSHASKHSSDLLNGKKLFFFADLIGLFIFGYGTVCIVRAVLVLVKVIKPLSGGKPTGRAKTVVEKFDTLAAANCPPGETLVTRFVGMYKPSFVWFLLFGPLYNLAMKQYLVLVTDKSYVFLQFKFLGGDPKMVGKFNRSEVGQPSASMGHVRAKIGFKLPNGRSLNLLVSTGKTVGVNDKVRELFLNKAA